MNEIVILRIGYRDVYTQKPEKSLIEFAEMGIYGLHYFVTLKAQVDSLLRDG